MATGVFRFLCLFDLAIPNNYGFYIETEEKPAFITFRSRNGQRVFSFVPDDYKWLNAEGESKSLLVAAVLKDGTRKPFRKFSSYQDKDSFSGGIVDEMLYNIIDVMFHVEDLKKLSSEEIDEQLKNWIQGTVDRFIDLYKYVTQDNTIDKSLVHKSPIIQILGSEETFELNNPVVVGEVNFLRDIVSWDNPVKNGCIKAICSEDNINKIGRLLEEGYRLQVFEQLLLQAKDQGHIFKNYALSVVLSETAFEVYLQHALMEYCLLKGVEQLPVGRNSVKKDYKEAITNGNVKERLIPYVKDLAGINIAASKEYFLWFERVYTLRNDIVHKGKQDISESDAGLAFGLVVSFIDYIKRILI